MQLSKFTDYSFRALIYLAKNQDKRCTADMLAEQLEASPHHMKKVLHKLAGHGYVRASKGRVGGLHLARDPKEINLSPVITIVSFLSFAKHAPIPATQYPIDDNPPVVR